MHWRLCYPYAYRKCFDTKLLSSDGTILRFLTIPIQYGRKFHPDTNISWTLFYPKQTLSQGGFYSSLPLHKKIEDRSIIVRIISSMCSQVSLACLSLVLFIPPCNTTSHTFPLCFKFQGHVCVVKYYKERYLITILNCYHKSLTCIKSSKEPTNNMPRK